MLDQPAQAERGRSDGRLAAVLSRALAVVSIVVLAAVGAGVAYLMGQRIVADQWPILVTGLGMATYLAVTLVDARHGLLLWIVTAPFARFVHLDLELGRGIPNLTLTRVMTGVLLVLILAQFAVRSRRAPRIILPDVLVIAFVAASALSVPHAILGLRASVQSFFDLLVVPTAVYFMARCLITDADDFRSVLVALLIIGTYFGLLATREQLTGDVWFYPEERSVQYTASIRRVVGLLGNPAYISVTIGMAVPWVWYLLLRQKRHRMGLLLAFSAMLAGIFFCMNRSGWIGLLSALIVLAILMPRFRMVFLVMLLLAVIVGGIYWVFILNSATVQERLTAQGPIDYRLETWGVALRMVRDHPIFGLGYENFRHVYKQYGYWDVYLRATPTPHNTFLWVVLMGGVVALVPYVLMLAAVLLCAVGVYLRGGTDVNGPMGRDAAAAFIASLAAVLVPSLVMDIFQGYYNTMVMFFIMGSFFGATAVDRESRGRLTFWQEAHALFVGQG